MKHLQRLRIVVFLILSLLASGSLHANGVLRNGNSAEAIATGGSNTASADNPIDALTGNPAGLGLINDSSAQLGLTMPFLDAEFANPSNPGGADADLPTTFIPDLAYAQRRGKVGFGFGLNTVALTESDWRFVDAPGGSTGTISYGLAKHRVKFLALRASTGLSAELAPGVHLGTSVGVIYNENTLQAPYVFQSNPALQSIKTQLDLKTDGLGYNATVGLMFQPDPSLNLGLRYTTPTTIHSEGRATGNASLNTGGLVGNYRYDAELETKLPAVVSLGAEWRARDNLELRGQIDWIQWSDAFDELPVTLTNGNNAVLNALLGSSRLNDTLPLNWKDRFVYRFGANYHYSDKTSFRAGYSYGQSPIPSSTLTPMLATIMEHSIGVGVGHRIGDYRIDFSYQWDLPTDQSIGQSALLAGEFNNSNIDLSVHWLTLTISLANPFN